MPFIATFLAGLIIAVGVTPMLRKKLLARGVIDQPDARKVHTRAIPRLGGVAIYLGFVVAVLTAYALKGAAFDEKITQFVGLLVAGTFIAVVGVFDDVYNVRAIYKLFTQIAAAMILIAFDISMGSLSNPFGGSIELGVWNYPVTIFWVIGVINAINLVDGLDGLASGVSLIVTMTIFLIALYLEKTYVALIALGLAGSILGFLRHNFYPAKIFMGDTGSMFIGLMISALGLISSQKSAVSFAILVPFIALGYPVIDTALAIFRRARAGKSIFTADREHIHHILLSYGYSHPKTVIFLYVICLFFATMAFLFAVYNKSGTFTVGVLFFVLIFIFLFIRMITDFKKKTEEDQETDDL
ncbi:MAG TPA: MraY family glycosyltransferase [bacterium]|nr:MraY family glycosyltransferase [bacterium]HMW33635.1 MraY family glycosyltransferase [bacterium]HMY35721.1 MraY family glycosyltransferase [bacterium]HMZ04265.1 MraY family glycosyltransferase [bacterium]HNB08777.1 MraY family glycosyltransferase [bacterium]